MGMDPEARERLSAIEAQLNVLPKMQETLDRLVRSSIQNEENRKRIEALEADADRLEAQHQELHTWAHSRWYVLATLTAAGAAIGSYLLDLLTIA